MCISFQDVISVGSGIVVVLLPNRIFQQLCSYEKYQGTLPNEVLRRFYCAEACKVLFYIALFFFVIQCAWIVPRVFFSVVLFIQMIYFGRDFLRLQMRHL